MTKIFKRNLEELLNEAMSPLYLMNYTDTLPGNNGTMYRTHRVSVAGFNDEDRVCELCLSTPPAIVLPDIDPDTVTKCRETADSWEREIRARLKALDIEIRDGRISDEKATVSGGLD